MKIYNICNEHDPDEKLLLFHLCDHYSPDDTMIMSSSARAYYDEVYRKSELPSTPQMDNSKYIKWFNSSSIMSASKWNIQHLQDRPINTIFFIVVTNLNWYDLLNVAKHCKRNNINFIVILIMQQSVIDCMIMALSATSELNADQLDIMLSLYNHNRDVIDYVKTHYHRYITNNLEIVKVEDFDEIRKINNEERGIT
jgi:BarA-like signal transduction histidine kinase